MPIRIASRVLCSDAMMRSLWSYQSAIFTPSGICFLISRDFGQRHLERLQFVWIDSDPVLFDATALNADTRDSGNRGERRTQCIEGEIAQLDERMRIGR